MNTESTFEKNVAGAAQVTTDIARTGLQLAENAIKKVWSLADAASEKPAPGEYLSSKAIKAVQGNDL
jgi:hypothetical protein